MKSIVRSLVTLTALGLAGAVTGGTAGAGQLPPAAEQQPSAPALRVHGFVQVIGEALGEVSLRPDQETDVERLSAQVEPLQAKVDDAENTLLLALADQVKAGHIDRAALQSQIDGYVSARRDVSGEIRAALEELHALLDASQREDFADALESRVHRIRRAMLAGEQLDDLADKLHLSDKQTAQIRADLQALAPTLETERTAIHNAIEAFRGDSFSIEQYLPQSEVAERATSRVQRIVDLTDAILGVLDAEQRDLLAARIHEAVEARSENPDEHAPGTLAPKSFEPVGDAAEHMWVGRGFRRGGWGGVRRGGVIVGGSGGFVYGRAVAFPPVVGFGWGW